MWRAVGTIHSSVKLTAAPGQRSSELCLGPTDGHNLSSISRASASWISLKRYEADVEPPQLFMEESLLPASLRLSSLHRLDHLRPTQTHRVTAGSVADIFSFTASVKQGQKKRFSD